MRLSLAVFCVAVVVLGLVGDSGGASVEAEEGRAWGKVHKGTSAATTTGNTTHVTPPSKTKTGPTRGATSKPHRTKGSSSSRPAPISTTSTTTTRATPSVTTTEVPTTPTPVAAREEPNYYYPSRTPQQPRPDHNKVDINETASMKLPGGAGFTKPTKYHYYPHNQHIYLLPECAIQQVCNAVYVRLNYTQPLCACPTRHREPCSASLRKDDLHTTELSIDPQGKALTLVKTCEPTSEMRVCKEPRDWSLLALQNVRTGKSHYLVLCRCPHENVLEGPMSHDQPSYASVPGIRVYGMMCVRKIEDNLRTGVQTDKRRGRGRQARMRRSLQRIRPAFPWAKIRELADTIDWEAEDEE